MLRLARDQASSACAGRAATASPSLGGGRCTGVVSLLMSDVDLDLFDVDSDLPSSCHLVRCDLCAEHRLGNLRLKLVFPCRSGAQRFSESVKSRPARAQASSACAGRAPSLWGARGTGLVSLLICLTLI